MVKLYTPIPLRYAVILIDPIASVAAYPYPDILDAAKEMKPKKYHQDIGLPWPNQPWYSFNVIPIAPSLPPNDEIATPEMCVPIFPNTQHPSNRMHIHTTPEFPYDNCYHWSQARQLGVRIRAKPEEFDDDGAFKLEPRQVLTLWELMGSDRITEEDLEENESGDDSASRQYSTTEGAEHETENVTASASAYSLGSCSEHSANSEFRAIVRTGIFGNRHEDKELFPLVWLELVEHLKQDDIPDPHDLYDEYDAVVRLVTEAKRRCKEEELQVSEQRVDEKSGHNDEGKLGMENENATAQNKRKRCRPKEVFRKLRARAAWMVTRMKHVLRIPYIPVWP